MILRRLLDYYDRRYSAIEDPIPGFGLSREKISFELVIDPSGGPSELNDLRAIETTVQKKVKPELRSRWMTVPYRGDRSSNVKANFLWDNTGYVFGRTRKDRIEEKKRVDFLKLHEELLARTPDKGLAAVVNFLASWVPTQYEQFPLAEEALEQNIVFRLKGVRSFVHDSGPLKDAWVSFFRKDIEQHPGISLIGDGNAAIPSTHFLVQGVHGAQPTGAAFSSFNDSAYTSYGWKSAYNSPVSIEDVFRYTSALKELLLYERKRIRIGDATVLFWAERRSPLEEYASEIFADAPPPASDATPADHERARQVRLFLSQLQEGYAGTEAVDPEDQTGFYILGLSAPSKSRLSVRFWTESTIGDMKARLSQHMRDTELVGGRDTDQPLMIRRIVAAAGRAETDTKGRLKGYDVDTVPPQLTSGIVRAVLTGGPYPNLLLVSMVNRLRADGVISHPRIAAIKASIVRNSRLQGRPVKLSVALDTGSADPPYVAGRLFAILEKLQSDAAGGRLNATIRDRYFSAASATPASVFPAILRLSQHHLRKLPDEGQREWSRLLVDRVTGKMAGWAATHNAAEQGLFAIGYYHQNQELYRKRTTKGAKT